jgi:hypothetical protein
MSLVRAKPPQVILVRAFLSLSATAAALVGCGGEGATTPSTAGGADPEPLSKAEFLHEADRICFAVESQIEAAADEVVTGRDDPPPSEVRRLVHRIVVPRLRSEADTIALLDPPTEDQDVVTRILEATERGADRLEADPLAATRGLPAPLRRAERLARAYGSEQCGLRGR